MIYAETKRGLRVVSYNIRKARGRDGRRDPSRILNVINALDADVVALQEADRRLGDRSAALPRALIERETDLDVLDVAANDVSLGWHGNAVLVRKDLSATGADRIALPGLEPRGAVRFKLNIDGPMSVVATHLGLRRRDRVAQLRCLSRVLSDEPSALIVGDFNEWSRTKGMEPIVDRFHVVTPGASFHSARPMVSLDRFALAGEVMVRASGVQQNALTRVASDHLPVWLDLDFG
ncbi:endonuclease/exonuclease/phosphatase family protein [Gymnodinialimonas sp. 2305UL16-5]|uniref:endonuclease/exonuclease/phosphatase family protein n=1 Tax=Gymnodinialimonas mytili TaxID=3126503 RepID=UPI0030B0C2CE